MAYHLVTIAELVERRPPSGWIEHLPTGRLWLLVDGRVATRAEYLAAVSANGWPDESATLADDSRIIIDRLPPQDDPRDGENAEAVDFDYQAIGLLASGGTAARFVTGVTLNGKAIPVTEVLASDDRQGWLLRRPRANDGCVYPLPTRRLGYRIETGIVKLTFARMWIVVGEDVPGGPGETVSIYDLAAAEGRRVLAHEGIRMAVQSVIDEQWCSQRRPRTDDGSGYKLGSARVVVRRLVTLPRYDRPLSFYPLAFSMMFAPLAGRDPLARLTGPGKWLR